MHATLPPMRRANLRITVSWSKEEPRKPMGIGVAVLTM